MDFSSLVRDQGTDFLDNLGHQPTRKLITPAAVETENLRMHFLNYSKLSSSEDLLFLQKDQRYGHERKIEAHTSCSVHILYHFEQCIPVDTLPRLIVASSQP